MKTWLWQRREWPALTFDARVTAPLITRARLLQGALDGKAPAVGLLPRSDVVQDLLTREVVATAAIEGERLELATVRSSVKRSLGLAAPGARSRPVDGLVEIINDATANANAPLDDDRLFRWQSALFPGGTSGVRRIAVGRYRSHPEPMQIVSGVLRKEVVHYEAVPSKRVPHEMKRFLRWFAKPPAIDGLARAALAHVWFESIHPFEDGNGRLGRAVADLALAQDHPTPVRLFSLSSQLLVSRDAYYDALNRAQTGGVDVTVWVAWFVEQFAAACERSSSLIDRAVEKARFWNDHAAKPLNARQRKVLQRLLDAGDGGFTGGLNAEKFAKLTGASKATATRDLSELVQSHLLWTRGQGKALRYFVNVPGWRHPA